MRRAVLGVVAVVAFGVRIIPLLRGGGLLFWGRYDDGVYFTASASLLDGRMPYRDYILLHPPLIAVVLLPFALLGRLTTDPTGLIAARLTWMLLGTLTAVLVARFAGRWGTLAALAAGLLYACSAAASYTDQSTFIEPAADLALLGAVILLTCERERPRHELAAGLLLGLALGGKIWDVVPVAMVLLCQLVGRRWASAGRVAVGTAVAGGAVLLPFFLAAPGQMWHRVVLDQVGRRLSKRTSLSWRLGDALGGRGLGLSTTGMHVVIVLMSLAALVAVVACLRDRRARLIALVFLADLAVLLRSPSYFRHYGHFLAAPLAVVLAVGWTIVGRRLPARRVLAGGAILIVAASGAAVAAQPLGRVFPRSQVKALLPSGCITADDPTVLIEVNRLSSDLRAHCPVPVDITGDSYGTRLRRRHDPAYQAWLRSYLRSGSAMILARVHHDGINRADVQALGTTTLHSGMVHVVVP